MAYGTLILACDQASERTHRRLMRMYCLAGNRSEAIRQYARCVRALDEELGVKPASSTVRLYEKIRQDQLDPLDLVMAGAFSASARLPIVLERLRELQSLLAEFQNRLDREVQAVELVLRDQH